MSAETEKVSKQETEEKVADADDGLMRRKLPFCQILLLEILELGKMRANTCQCVPSDMKAV